MSEVPTLESLEDLRHVLADLPGPDRAAAQAAAAREPSLTKPPGSLGRLEDLAAWLAAWQGRHPPGLGNPVAQVFAGNHGVVAQGVSAYPAEVTAQMVENFKAGGAAINQLCTVAGIELRVDALALDRPSADFTAAPAMSERECLDALVFGMGAVTAGTDVLCLGEMGIGNTTSAAAMCHALYGGTAAEWTGAGTGVAGDALETKVRVVGAAVKTHAAAMTDGLEVLRHLGGRELAAISGAVVAARFRRVPVLLDGYLASAAAAVLDAVAPGALEHCQVAHVSAEAGHARLLDALGKRPLLNLDMRLGEASGAALAVPILKAACACHGGMATFAEAGVSGKDGAGNGQ